MSVAVRCILVLLDVLLATASSLSLKFCGRGSCLFRVISCVVACSISDRMYSMRVHSSVLIFKSCNLALASKRFWLEVTLMLSHWSLIILVND